MIGSFLAPSFGDWPQWETPEWSVTDLKQYRSASPITCGLWEKKRTLPAGAIVRSFTARRADADMSMVAQVTKHYYPDGLWFSTDVKRKAYDASGGLNASGQSSTCRVPSGGDARQEREDLSADVVADVPTGGSVGVGVGPLLLLTGGVVAALFFFFRRG